MYEEAISNIAVITMVTLIILPIIVFPASAIDVFGNIRTPQIETTEKIICSATIDDNFADDSVLVVLKNGANSAFKTSKV